MRCCLAKIILEAATVLALAFLLDSCGGQPNCPTCGTTSNGAYAVLNTIPVPEHNPTGEPGGPFNSFDISWFDPNLQRVYTSDRIGLDIVDTDAKNNFAVNTIGGLNQIANAGSPTPAVEALPGLAAGIWTSSPHLRTSFQGLATTGCSEDFPGRNAALRAPTVLTLFPVPTDCS